MTRGPLSEENWEVSTYNNNFQLPNQESAACLHATMCKRNCSSCKILLKLQNIAMSGWCDFSLLTLLLYSDKHKSLLKSITCLFSSDKRPIIPQLYMHPLWKWSEHYKSNRIFFMFYLSKFTAIKNTIDNSQQTKTESTTPCDPSDPLFCGRVVMD